MSSEEYRKKDNLKHLIKSFESQLKSEGISFYSIEEFEQIIDYYIEEGNNKKALHACNLGIEQYPFSTELKLEKAQVLSNLNQIDESLDLLDNALLMQPNDPDILTMKGNIQSASGKYEDAVESYLQAIPFSDELEEIYYSIGLCYQNLLKYDDAIVYYKKTIQLNINHENALYELAFCLDVTEQLEKSISYYKKFIDQDPYSQYAWYNLGIVYNKLEQYEKAVESYEYAIAIDDSFASAYFNLGNSFMNLKQYSKAIDCFRETIDSEGPSAEVYCCLAAAYEKLQHYDLAIKYYQRSYKLDNFYDDAWFGAGYCFCKQEKWHQAIHFLSKAIKINSENPVYWKTLADAEFQTGNIVSSLDAYEEANELDPEDIDIALKWSYLYYDQGDYEEALSIVLTSIEENPEESLLYYRATAYLIAAGKYKEAFAYLENGLILNFENHISLLEFFPKLETQKALFKIIDQYRKENH